MIPSLFSASKCILNTIISSTIFALITRGMLYIQSSQSPSSPCMIKYGNTKSFYLSDRKICIILHACMRYYSHEPMSHSKCRFHYQSLWWKITFFKTLSIRECLQDIWCTHAEELLRNRELRYWAI